MTFPKELRNIDHHHAESKKRKSSERISGAIDPYCRHGYAGKTSKTISTIAILWPVKDSRPFSRRGPLRWRYTLSFPLFPSNDSVSPGVNSTVGHTPSTAGTFRKKFRKDPGNALRAFPGIPVESTAGCPKPYHSRHLKAPEHFQNSLPPSTAGGASFFRSGSGEGLPEPVMEFPAVLGVFLKLEI